MGDLEHHLIETGSDGILIGAESRLDEMVSRLANQEDIVLHFHGGLVDRETGIATANNLHSWYEGAGAYPVFFIWRSGLLEVLKGNLGEIAEENLFANLVMKIAKWTKAKLGYTGGIRSASPLPVPPQEIDVWRELDRVTQDEEPYRDEEVPPDFEELTDAEATAFIAELNQSAALKQAAIDIVDHSIDVAVETERGVEVRVKATEPSLISPEVVEELAAEAEAGEGEKGILELGVIAVKAAKVLAAVVSRLATKRDHGVYPTVVEEVLREFYVGNFATSVWTAMKGETADTFAPGDMRGGRLFFEKLGRKMTETGRRPRVTLVGHSTGAVFINNLLEHVAAAKASPTDPFPADFRFDNVVFLAPACTYRDMSGVMTEYEQLVNRFRMFTMTDEAESSDALIPGVYTRSLLYFISGVLEEENGRSTPDAAVVGMQRFFADDHGLFNGPPYDRVRNYLAGGDLRTIWSPAQGPIGERSNALKHADFDNDHPTLESVTSLI